MNKEYLFHYTNLQSLALILKTKTIKFNSLINMDDKEEKITKDIENGGKYCFVSSWTDEDKESIPMWNLYSHMTGIRIKMERDPFIKYIWEVPFILDEKIESYFDIKQIYKYDIFPYITDNILYKIEYTNDKNKIFPNIKKYVENGFHINYDILGKYKNDVWAFQKEWRYILYIRPVKLSSYLESIQKGKAQYKNNIDNKSNR